MNAEAPVNTWEQISDGDVAVSYFAARHRGFGSYSAVWRKGPKIDPTGPWYYYGKKGFPGKRKESLPKALEWASKEFGIEKWKRNSMGDYVDASKSYKALRK